MNMKTKVKTGGLALALAALLGNSAIQSAQQQGVTDVVMDANGVSIYASADVVNFSHIQVRIMGPNDTLVLDTNSLNGMVEWLVAGHPDGHYRYEALVVSQDPAAKNGGSEGEDPQGVSVMRESGSFDVENGTIIVPSTPEDKGASAEPQGFWKGVSEAITDAAGHVLNALVPTANAADLTASSSYPEVYFVDTTPEPDNYIFTWRGDDNYSGSADRFVLEANDFSDAHVLSFTVDSDAAYSMEVDTSGDIGLANDSVFIDRSANYVGIGTTTPSEELTIYSGSPTIALYDSAGRTWEINSNSNSTVFDIADVTAGTSPFGIEYTTPDNTLWLDSTGNGRVGIGTAAPSYKLHAKAGSDASIMVENTDTTKGSDRFMFRLKDASSSKVRFSLGNSVNTWTFDTTGNDFQINLLGTGVNEFNVNASGDSTSLRYSYAVAHVNTSSRESKTDFEPVDESTILDKLAALPLSTWRYKIEDEQVRHLGPVSEDFQKAFGLSGDTKHIVTVDADGVALAAIKALNSRMQEKTAEIEKLRQTNEQLANRNEQLDKRLKALEDLLLKQGDVAAR